MSEKILDLADRAYDEHRNYLMEANIPDIFCVAFAHMIIKECITILDEDDGATHHAELLQKHFGVE